VTVSRFLIAMAALSSLPAFAQSTTVQQQPGTTTTVQSTPGSTTVQTQPQPPPPSQPGTQVVVNPPPPESAPPPPPATTTRVRTYEQPVVVEERHRAPMAIIATDALYGGIAGALVGGGIALLNDGDHWQRDLMIGAGGGILVGVGIGVVQAVMDSNDNPRTTAVSDQVRPVGARAPGGTALAVMGHF
jgi:hypothetical protein